MRRLAALSVSLALVVAHVALAQKKPTRIDDLEASIVELEAHRVDADEATVKLLDQQIASLRDVIALKKRTDPEAEKLKVYRPKLSAEAKAFFTPVAPAKLPAWVPDTLTRAQVKDELLKCPKGARVYADARAVECRLPKGPGSVPPTHGLALWFYSTGKLKAQRMYEDGKLRWEISYYAVGGRESEGAYDSVEPKVYRENGLHTSYAPDGTVTGQTEFRSGQKQGWSKLWEDDGFPSSATRYEKDAAVEHRGPDGKPL